MTVYKGRIRNLAKSAAEWTAANPVLQLGEFGASNVGSNAPTLKIGDGVRAFSALPNLLALGATPGLDQPTALVGLTPKTGSAPTAMYSDAAPALDQSIVPTWLGLHTFNQVPAVPAGAWSNAKLATMPAATLKGNNTGAAAAPIDLTVTQVKTLLNYTASEVGALTQAAADLRYAAITHSHAAGDITSGTFGVARGGTGLATFAQGDILYASAANTLSALAKNATASRYLSNTGTTNNPAWAQIDLSNGVTGTLPVGNGGTGATTLTGYVKGAGTVALSAVTQIPYTDISGTPTIPTAATSYNTVKMAALAGSGTTFIPANATLAIDPAIAPTWTGTHSFTGAAATSVAASAASLGLATGRPAITLVYSGAVADTRLWRIAAGNILDAALSFEALTDAGVGKEWLRVTRLAGAISAITFGNGTDNPTFNFAGTGVVTAAAFNAASARALKRETGAPTGARAILSRLRPIFYKMLAGGDEAREQLGLIAEEVHEICPQLSDGHSVSYDRLALLLLADWQEAHAHG